MLLWIVAIVVLIALTIIGTYVFGLLFGRGENMPPVDDPETVVADNRQAVADGRAQDIRFELVARGYRPDQVDAVIADFTARLARYEADQPPAQPGKDFHPGTKMEEARTWN